MSAGEVTILHNLNSYLTSNNYVMHSANSYFINTDVTNAGYSFSVYCTLFEYKIRAKATLSYKTDSATSVSVRLNAGFLCSAILTKPDKKGINSPFYFLKIAEHNKPLYNLKVISIFEDTGVGVVHQRVT